MKSLPVLALLMLAAGCGPTTAQTRLTALWSEFDQVNAAYVACRSSVLLDPTYADVARRMPLTPVVSPAAMADRAMVRPRDRAVATAFFDALARCRDHISGHLPAALQPTLPVYQQGWALYDAAAARLVGGRMTWGAYLTEYAAIQADASMRLAAAQQAAIRRMALGVAAGVAASPAPYASAPAYVGRP